MPASAPRPGTDRDAARRPLLIFLPLVLFAALMALFLAHREVSAVTWWGVADDHTSLNAGYGVPGDDAPLLFDRSQQPKPAYWAILRHWPG